MSTIKWLIKLEDKFINKKIRSLSFTLLKEAMKSKDAFLLYIDRIYEPTPEMVYGTFLHSVLEGKNELPALGIRSKIISPGNIVLSISDISKIYNIVAKYRKDNAPSIYDIKEKKTKSIHFI